jgi:hypothetical protein
MFSIFGWKKQDKESLGDALIATLRDSVSKLS